MKYEWILESMIHLQHLQTIPEYAGIVLKKKLEVNLALPLDFFRIVTFSPSQDHLSDIR